MIKQNTSSVPDENKIEEFLGKIQPAPGVNFYKAVERASWRTEPPRSGATKIKLHLKLAVATVLLLMIASLASTPQGRAWAQEAVHFFQRINSPIIQLSDEQTRSMNEVLNNIDKPYDIPLIPVIIPSVLPELASISGCEMPQTSQSYRCQVALAESKLGFDLKELPAIPDGWEFKSISVNTNSQYAVMVFDLDLKYFTDGATGFTSYSSLQLIQWMGDFTDFDWYQNNPWEAVPIDKVELVTVGGYKGEYAEGRFGFSQEDSELTWSDMDHRRRLAWNDGTRWYLIDFEPNLNLANTMGKDELIHLAESLTSSSRDVTESLNPDRLLSISDAEKVSGLDLKAPTLLPMDMDFSYARFLSGKAQVQLVYGINEDLIIHEWKGDPVDYKKPLGKYEYTCEIVNMNGEDALYCSFESKKMRSFLWWHKDGMNYQMYYNDSLISGGRIDREQMLLIAESMQDIDDFFKKGSKTYEQTALYAQAIGIDLKKFSEIPSGWTYTNFWSDAFAKCIDLIYTSTTGNSTLYIQQCGTGYRSSISTFPYRSIERVRIGNDKGQFIAGGFSTMEDGKQIWDSSLPVKQLQWQEDGLWMQITLYGEQAHILNKDDLIALAESLR